MHHQLSTGGREVYFSCEDTYVLQYYRVQEQRFDPREILCAQRAFEHLVRVRVELRKDRDVADRDPELCEHRRVASHESVEMFA